MSFCGLSTWSLSSSYTWKVVFPSTSVSTFAFYRFSYMNQVDFVRLAWFDWQTSLKFLWLMSRSGVVKLSVKWLKCHHPTLDSWTSNLNLNFKCEKKIQDLIINWKVISYVSGHVYTFNKNLQLNKYHGHSEIVAKHCHILHIFG